MNFENCKEITKDTDFDKLEIHNMDWDFYYHGTPYTVCHIDEYCHHLHYEYGRETRETLWAYPRGEKPSYMNLIPYMVDSPVRFDIHYTDDVQYSTGMESLVNVQKTTILRNGEEFYSVMGSAEYSIPKAMTIIHGLDTHALDFYTIDYDTKMIGRKVWWHGQPAIITRYVKQRGCVVLAPDIEAGITKFECPIEWKNDDSMWDTENESEILINVFKERYIDWFRVTDY